MVDKPPQAPQSAGRKAHAANTKVAKKSRFGCRNTNFPPNWNEIVRDAGRKVQSFGRNWPRRL